MTTAELVDKFRHNADGVLSASATEGVLDALLHLDEVDDIRPVAALLAPRC